MSDEKQPDVAQELAERIRKAVEEQGGDNKDIERAMLNVETVDAIAAVIVGNVSIHNKQAYDTARNAHNPEVRRRAIGLVASNEQVIFRDIARKDTNPNVRRAAVARLERDDLLKEIALRNNYEETALEAAGRIHDPEILAEIASKTTFDSVRALATRRHELIAQ